MIYQSLDKKFGVQLRPVIVQELIGHVSKAGNKETGGILIGYYTNDHKLAMVTRISGPPPDSQHGYTWFKRGLQGLQSLINKSWVKKQYYLGEWHFHPHAAVVPSSQDKNQMKEIALSDRYHCPEPVLLIFGGPPERYELGIFVMLHIGKLIRLHVLSAPASPSSFRT